MGEEVSAKARPQAGQGRAAAGKGTQPVPSQDTPRFSL